MIYAFIRQRQASSAYNCTDKLPELQIPTVIMHGKKDKIAPYTLAEEMHSGIKDSRMLTFAGGHLSLSPTVSKVPLHKQKPPLVTKMSRLQVARMPFSSTLKQDCLTTYRFTWCLCCLVRVYDYSTI